MACSYHEMRSKVLNEGLGEVLRVLAEVCGDLQEEVHVASVKGDYEMASQRLGDIRAGLKGLSK